MGPHHTAVERHLPCGISHYLPANTGEHALP